jgi:hypothetical protein
LSSCVAGLESAALGSSGEGLGGGRAGRQLRAEQAAAQGGFTASRHLLRW